MTGINSKLYFSISFLLLKKMLLFIVRKIIKRLWYSMKKIGTAFLFLLLSHYSYAQSDSLMLVRIANECLIHSESYVHLEELCKEIGGRLSGSPQAAQSVDMVVKWANRLPGVRVEKQPCKVPHWVRGSKEEAIVFNYLKSWQLQNNIK